VISLNEGSFPGEKSISKIDDLEEERRLFYVACSRAKSRLFLTYPQITLMYGKLNSTALPSRFLAEISNSYYDIL
jgi:DNA helicase-2/ATP-dependent DNA helicase PcrA